MAAMVWARQGTARPAACAPAEKVRKATIQLRDPNSSRQCTAYPAMYASASRWRRIGPHDLNGTRAPGMETRAAGTGERPPRTSIPAESGPAAATRKAARQPRRVATSPARASDSAVPSPNEAV